MHSESSCSLVDNVLCCSEGLLARTREREREVRVACERTLAKERILLLSGPSLLLLLLLPLFTWKADT